MFDLIDEMAFAMFTADTGLASRAEWEKANKDRYYRMATVAHRVAERHLAPKVVSVAQFCEHIRPHVERA